MTEKENTYIQPCGGYCKNHTHGGASHEVIGHLLRCRTVLCCAVLYSMLPTNVSAHFVHDILWYDSCSFDSFTFHFWIWLGNYVVYDFFLVQRTTSTFMAKDHERVDPKVKYRDIPRHPISGRVSLPVPYLYRRFKLRLVLKLENESKFRG